MKQRNVRMIETNGITLKVIVEGSGPLLLLLHGFPQCAYLWRNQIDDLVAAGYQVAVPDQRGYGGSDKPAEVEAYDLLQLPLMRSVSPMHWDTRRSPWLPTTGVRSSAGTSRCCTRSGSTRCSR